MYNKSCLKCGAIHPPGDCESLEAWRNRVSSNAITLDELARAEQKLISGSRRYQRIWRMAKKLEARIEQLESVVGDQIILFELIKKTYPGRVGPAYDLEKRVYKYAKALMSNDPKIIANAQMILQLGCNL